MNIDIDKLYKEQAEALTQAKALITAYDELEKAITEHLEERRPKLRAKTLQKKYPRQWEEIEDAVKYDINLCIGKGPRALTDNDIDRIAYNAAFFGVSAIDRALRDKKWQLAKK